MRAGLGAQQPPVGVCSMAARLCALERVRVEAMRSAGASADGIADRLGRHPSTRLPQACDASRPCRSEPASRGAGGRVDSDSRSV
ncbi:helix-turn-helix domain-containing protein [Candidatus Poriferisodalis sp.]|uniref:helix-turn-helix domain-containing protein n=1 Tax=Candidatus Poriferisodalis sp. TaxID=3101277 RepID=UPI003B02BEEB